MRTCMVCREASASNIISSISLALEAKKKGIEVSVLFTEEALVALCQGIFDWSRQLRGQTMRLTIADNGAILGLPTMGGKGEARQIDVRQLVANALLEGVTILASEFWINATGLKGRLPDGVKLMDNDSVVAALESHSFCYGAL